jgi:hypothetical protein
VYSYHMILKSPIFHRKPMAEFINEQSPQEPTPLYTLGHIPQQMATPDEQ